MKQETQSKQSIKCKLYYELRAKGEVNEEELQQRLIRLKLDELTNDESLLEEQREVLANYRKWLFSGLAKAKSILTKKTNMTEIHRFAQYIKKPFNAISRDDIVNYASYSMEQGIKQSTISSRLTVVKAFYRWLGLPKLMEDIKLKIVSPKLEESELLTHQEINQMIACCHLPRDKAFIKTLYESGARIDEILHTQIKDLVFDDYGAVLQIKVSKTKPRPIRLIDSVVLLQEHINCHQFKADRDAPLFYSFKPSSYGRGLKYTGAYHILKQAGKLAQITKPIRPHLLRHARLNWLGKKEGFNERDLRLFAGWDDESKMTSVYIHYGHQQVEDKLLKNRGMMKESKSREDVRQQKELQVKVCPRCNRQNDPSSAYCNCGMALDLKTVINDKAKVDNEVNKTIQYLMEVMQDPVKRKDFEDWKRAKLNA